MHSKLLSGASAACLAACAISPAWAASSEAEALHAAAAEDNTSPSPAKSAETLAEIVVTAQKRTESLQVIPFSVAAVSGEVLQQRAITTVSDLQFAVPGLSFTGAGTATRISGFNVRGIGTTVFSEAIESSVGVVVDGVIMGRQGAALSDLNDLERVEVLRGPQGTLFGKNTSAGVINIVTKDPTDELSGNASLSYGNFNELKINGVLSAPLVKDALAVRISAYSNTRDGFVRNLNDGSLLNDSDQKGVRLKLLAKPNDTLRLSLIADYSDANSNCCVPTTRSYGNGIQGDQLPPPFQVNPIKTGELAAGIVAGPANTAVLNNTESYARQKSRGVSLQIDQDLADFALTSITAYRLWDQSDNTDNDNSVLSLLRTNSGAVDQHQFSQEIRLTSPADRKFTYIIGALLFKQTSKVREIQSGTLGFDLLPPIFPTPLSFFLPTPSGTTFLRDQQSRVETRNIAVFGEGSLHLTDRFKVFAGARYLTERMEVSATRQNNAVTQAYVPLLGQGWAATSVAGKQTDDAVTWRVGADYTLSNVMLFANYSRGYKGAGFNLNLGVQQLKRVEPEIPTSVEIGFKSSWFDRRLTLNATLFSSRFSNFQAEAFVRDAATGTGAFTITNAGKLKTEGVEVELSARPAEGLTLGSGVSYLHAVYDEFVNAPCYPLQGAAQGCVNGVQDLTGKDLVNAPRWKLSFDGRYDFDMPIVSGTRAYIQASYAWRSRSNSSATNDPGAAIAAYGLLDAGMGLLFENGLELSVFGRNLADKKFDDLIFNSPFDAGGFVNYPSFASRRTYGARIRLEF